MLVNTVFLKQRTSAVEAFASVIKVLRNTYAF